MYVALAVIQDFEAIPIRVKLKLFENLRTVSCGTKGLTED